MASSPPQRGAPREGIEGPPATAVDQAAFVARTCQLLMAGESSRQKQLSGLWRVVAKALAELDSLRTEQEGAAGMLAAQVAEVIHKWRSSSFDAGDGGPGCLLAAADCEEVAVPNGSLGRRQAGDGLVELVAERPSSWLQQYSRSGQKASQNVAAEEGPKPRGVASDSARSLWRASLLANLDEHPPLCLDDDDDDDDDDGRRPLASAFYSANSASHVGTACSPPGAPSAAVTAKVAAIRSEQAAAHPKRVSIGDSNTTELLRPVSAEDPAGPGTGKRDVEVSMVEEAPPVRQDASHVEEIIFALQAVQEDISHALRGSVHHSQAEQQMPSPASKLAHPLDDVTRIAAAPFPSLPALGDTTYVPHHLRFDRARGGFTTPTERGVKQHDRFHDDRPARADGASAVPVRAMNGAASAVDISGLQYVVGGPKVAHDTSQRSHLRDQVTPSLMRPT
eukprot:SM000105S13888  [mRNA]  locus=s105:487007:488577:+ [translate_table: standard]